MEPISVGEIVLATGGVLVLGDPRTLLGPVGTPPKPRPAQVTTDSRTCQPGDLFFAIRGARFDGHAFLGECLERGAAGCVVSRVPDPLRWPPSSRSALIQVRDTRQALGDLARFYRGKVGSRARRVGISGSCGKSTVKEMIAQILMREGETIYTQGNLNNEIGCPLSVLQFRAHHRFGVFEIGASAPGEVRRLAEIVAPDLALVTNIHLEHAATFGDLEDIARGESEIFEGLAGPDGIAVIPEDDERRDFLKSRAQSRGARILTFGLSRQAHVYAEEIQPWPKPTQFVLVRQERPGRETERLRCTLPVPGTFNVLNACAAACAAWALGVSSDRIAESLSEFVPMPMRFEIHELENQVVLVNDSYNANPGSMRSAIEGFVQSFPHKRLCAVLGDMLELGEVSRQEHERLGGFVARFPFARVLLYGPQSQFVREGARRAFADEKTVTFCPDKDALRKAVEECLEPETAILFKASRGMRLEEFIRPLLEGKVLRPRTRG